MNKYEAKRRKKKKKIDNNTKQLENKDVIRKHFFCVLYFTYKCERMQEMNMEEEEKKERKE